MGFLRSLSQDRRGIAAVEFALIFPIFLVLFLGTVEITRATIAHKKAQKVAYTVDQIVNGSSSLTKEQVQKILSASATLMGPLDKSKLTLEVAYHFIDQNGKITTQWLQRLAGAGTQSLGTETLPDQYKTARQIGFLTTRVRYDLPSAVSTQFFETLGLTAESIVRPRPRGAITCSNC